MFPTRPFTQIWLILLLIAGYCYTANAEPPCPIDVNFTPVDTAVSQNESITFKNQSTGATTYKWYINNQLVGSAKDLTYSFTNVGAYIIKLIASDGTCSTEKISTVVASQQCYQTSFQKILRSPNNESVAQVYNMPDESTIIVGSVILAGKTDKDGLIIKLDRKGKILWSKSFGGPGDDEFSKIIYCVDGGCLMAIGQTKSFGNTAGSAWAMATNMYGDVQWSSAYSDNTPSGIIFTDITNIGNSVGISAVYHRGSANSDAVVLKLYNFDGRMMVCKKLSNNSTDEASAIQYTYDTITVASTSKVAGTSDMIITKLDWSGEQVFYSKRIHIPNTNNQPLFITKKSDSYIISSVITDASGNNPKPLWTNISQNLNVLSALQVNHPTTLNNAPAHTLADGALWNGSSQGNKLTLSAYSNNSKLVGKSFSYAQNISLKSIWVNTDSSVSAVSSIAGTSGDDILIGKITLDGASPGCTSSEATTNTSTLSTTVSNDGWENISDIILNIAEIKTLSVTDLTYSIETLCEAPECKTEDAVNCNVETQLKIFADDYNKAGFNNILVRNNDILATGGVSYGTGMGVTSFTFNGKINYIKKYGDKDFNPYIPNFIKDADNNLVYIQGISRSYNMSVMKTDPEGNPIWTTGYNIPGWTNTTSGTLSKITECSDGNYFFAYMVEHFPNESSLVIIKINKNNGSVIYTKEYFTSKYSFGIGDTKRIGDNILLICNSAGGPYPKYESYLFSFNEIDGSLTAAKQFSNTGFDFYLNDINTFGTGYLISGQYVINDYVNNIFTNGFYFSVLDEKLQLKKQKFINIENQNTRPEIIKTGNYEYVVKAFSYNFAGANLPQLFKIDSALNVIWVRKTNTKFKEYTYPGQIGLLPDKSLVVVGSKEYAFGIGEFGNGIFAKFTPDGSLLGCPSLPISFTYEDYVNTLKDIPVQPLATPSVTTLQVNTVVTDAPILTVQSIKCNTPSACTFLKIDGSPNICNYKDTIAFKAIRNKNCLSAIQWHNDSSYTTIVSYSDSSVSLVFKKPGSSKLFATIDGGCVGLIQDSLQITAASSTITLNLGNDTTICAGTNLKLHAHKEFQTFKWQDGSTDSTFTATKTGKYFVETTDYCGHTFSDTITINVVDAATLNLPSVVAHCANDTLQLSANAGFDTYTWEPNYFITDRFTKDVKIFSPKDTSYILKVTTSTGCNLNDTIKVNVIQPDKINLGNDTSLCSNQSLTLNIPTSYTNISWSTGSNSNSIIVTTAGYFSVSAKDKKNCNVYDTLQIVNIFETPLFELGNDTSICSNKPLMLSAPTGFTNYQWSNGNTSNAIQASTQGLYWLTAKNGSCTHTDSVTVLNVFKAAQINLGNDTSLCNNQSLILEIPSSYTNISWSTGSNSNSITVMSAGYFSVSATDQNNCNVYDTLQVVKIFDTPVFELGNDTSICSDKPLVLSAPIGFTSYQWRNGNTSNSIQVSTPALYWLTAKNGSCTHSDSVTVLNVFKPAQINLGNDTSFCSNQSITLNVPTNFTNISWSTGSTANTIVASTTGYYSVKGKDVNGCTASDTLQILSVFDVPVFNLGKDTSICDNRPFTLSAPSGFSNYTWNNGSNSSSIVVTQPGNYSLTIKNGMSDCSNSDTITIVNVYSTIKNLLDPTALICPYETFVIKAKGIFNQYLWNTNELTPSITIYRGGAYTLTVTDQNKCIITDSINVSEKECEPKIFFPTAFTPNNDGKNDLYRPIATQLMEYFKLEIYNRFGQKVFESSNANVGWNGAINGILQPSGNFVWKAAYKFYGEIKKEEKGSFVLIN